MKLSSWGNYPQHECREHRFDSLEQLRAVLGDQEQLVPRGNGRSYGDSALADHLVSVRQHNLLLGFDESSGLLHVEAGALLKDVIDVFVPRGWFFAVVPGTQFVTIGGAIASDVHGKNHHNAGCFSQSVASLNLMLPDGSIARCSPNENAELFRATCGGMGLTGIILDAELVLQRIGSTNIRQSTKRTRNLRETFDRFEESAGASYSVAWIDCLARGDSTGRSILSTGEFTDDGSLMRTKRQRISVPFNLPAFTLNRFSVALFNASYYRAAGDRESTKLVSLDSFFFPLDAVANWNRVYGRKGFVQYQCVLPKSTSFEGLGQMLDSIAAAGAGSFLAVLKLFGKSNANYLSFPMEGYTLALDFRVQPRLFRLLDRLDAIVLQHAGRIYLTKDARVPKAVFDQGYEKVEEFRALRRKHEMDTKFQSLQSLRLGL